MADKTCSDCINMRGTDGFCRATGKMVAALSPAPSKCFVSRDEVEATIKAAPRPEKKPRTKVCKTCGRELPLEDFRPHNKSRDGHSGTCRECASAKMRDAHAKRKERNRIAAGMEKVPDGMKRCTKCGRVLPVSEFGSRRKSGDGLQGHCKDCVNAYARELNHRLHGGKEVAELQRGGAREKVTSDKNVPLSQITPEALVAALRSRGWTVTCTRTVEEAL